MALQNFAENIVEIQSPIIMIVITSLEFPMMDAIIFVKFNPYSIVVQLIRIYALIMESYQWISLTFREINSKINSLSKFKYFHLYMHLKLFRNSNLVRFFVLQAQALQCKA